MKKGGTVLISKFDDLNKFSRKFQYLTQQQVFHFVFQWVRIIRINRKITEMNELRAIHFWFSGKLIISGMKV